MWPLLKNGDEILVSKNSYELRKGDIITVHNSYGRILTHRIIDEKKLITKGDNNVFPEKALIGSSYKLIGKVAYVIKNGKKNDINKLNTIFFKYSFFEMKIYASIKNYIPFNTFIYCLKKITYSSFIFIVKIRYGRSYSI
ncbi:S24/S26 family peptidase [Polaribacter sp. Z022]|uniref:S24/S26 family peptidase n=1 Tax=Polaribacter sp. Z022 TaxID=2927125 RepID=UPI002020C67A|nr:S24/S26 family peptidase [Polaribacter sp. Z022]MCL7753097.1 S24/S26 family peptidase [Polaribacter sp. Z022]